MAILCKVMICAVVLTVYSCYLAYICLNWFENSSEYQDKIDLKIWVVIAQSTQMSIQTLFFLEFTRTWQETPGGICYKSCFVKSFAITNGVLWCFSPFILLFSCIWSICGIQRILDVEEPVKGYIWQSALLVQILENLFSFAILSASIIIIYKVVKQHKKDEREAKMNNLIETGDFYETRRSTFVDMIIDRLDLVSNHPQNRYDLERLGNFIEEIDDEGLENLKANEDQLCAICYQDYKISEYRIWLPVCKHGYHMECAIEWIAPKGTCPVCRSGVKCQLLRDFHGQDRLISNKNDVSEPLIV